MPRPDQQQKRKLTRPAPTVAIQFLGVQGKGYPNAVLRWIAPSREDKGFGGRGYPGTGLIALKIH